MSDRAADDQGVIRFFTDVWPLFALAVIGALVVRACLPAPAAPAAAVPNAAFDPKTAVRGGNWHAMTALDALTAESSAAEVLHALNLIVVDFKAGSSTLPDDAEPALTQAAKAVQERPASERFEITGHATSGASELSDLELSRRRAQAVVDFLVNQGVASQRLQARGVGETAPRSNGPDDSSSLRNQHLEFALLSD